MSQEKPYLQEIYRYIVHHFQIKVFSVCLFVCFYILLISQISLARIAIIDKLTSSYAWLNECDILLTSLLCMSEENSKEKEYLNFWKDRNDGYSNAQDHINAYEELVFSAILRLCVENIEKHNKNQ